MCVCGGGGGEGGERERERGEMRETGTWIERHATDLIPKGDIVARLRLTFLFPLNEYT